MAAGEGARFGGRVSGGAGEVACVDFEKVESVGEAGAECDGDSDGELERQASQDPRAFFRAGGRPRY